MRNCFTSQRARSNRLNPETPDSLPLIQQNSGPNEKKIRSYKSPYFRHPTLSSDPVNIVNAKP